MFWHKSSFSDEAKTGRDVKTDLRNFRVRKLEFANTKNERLNELNTREVQFDSERESKH